MATLTTTCASPTANRPLRQLPDEIISYIISLIVPGSRYSHETRDFKRLFICRAAYSAIIPRIYAGLALTKGKADSVFIGLNLGGLGGRGEYEEEKLEANGARLDKMAQDEGLAGHATKHLYTSAADHERKLRALSHVRDLDISCIPSIEISEGLLRLAKPLEDPSSKHGSLAGRAALTSLRMSDVKTIDIGDKAIWELALFQKVNNGRNHPFIDFLIHAIPHGPNSLLIDYGNSYANKEDSDWLQQQPSYLRSSASGRDALEKEWTALMERRALDVTAPLFEHWRVEHLTIRDYDGGIVPAPAGAAIDIRWTFPYCDCKSFWLRCWCKIHECDLEGYEDIIRRMTSGILRSLGHKGYEDTALLGQEKAVKKVKSYKLTGFGTRDENYEYADWLRAELERIGGDKWAEVGPEVIFEYNEDDVGPCEHDHDEEEEEEEGDSDYGW